METGFKPELIAQLRSFIAARLDAECRAGWPIYRRIPCEGVRKTLVYFSQLPSSDWLDLRDDFIAFGLYNNICDRELAPEPGRSEHDAYSRYSRFVFTHHDWALQSPWSLRNLLLMLDHGKGPLSEDLRRQVPMWVVEKARATQLAKVADIRRVMKPAFAFRFGAKAENLGDGIWCYRGECGSVRFDVEVSFGNYCDFHFFVAADDRDVGLKLNGLTYSGLCGLPGNCWDCLTKPTIDQYMAFMMDIVERLCFVPREWHVHLQREKGP